MGAGGQFDSEKFFHETDETRAAARDDLFEKILQRIAMSGAVIESDETYPYYKDINGEEEETGSERVVEFEMNSDDWRISRVVEHSRPGTHGIEKMEKPHVDIHLEKRPAGSDKWEAVDLSNFS